MPDTVTYIGIWAFYANDITELTLGNSLQVIGKEAFHSNKITNIIFPNSLKKINSGTFMNNNLTSIPSLDNIDMTPDHLLPII